MGPLKKSKQRKHRQQSNPFDFANIAAKRNKIKVLQLYNRSLKLTEPPEDEFSPIEHLKATELKVEYVSIKYVAAA